MSRKFAVLTTFNQQGLQLYGQRFINSYVDRMPEEVDLYIYAERCNPAVRKSNHRIEILDHERSLPQMIEFKKRYKNDPRANGQSPDKKRLDHRKAFKWDAIKFCNKVYAVCDAARRAKRDGADVIIWMDADSYLHTKMPIGFLEKFVPNDVLLTYLGRGHKYSECGWYSINLNHKDCDDFVNAFQKMYDDAENGIFKEIEWHDSYIFDRVREKFEQQKGTKNKNVSSGIVGEGHPIINSDLGAYLDHMKGDRKRFGISEKKDLKNTARTEDYWKGLR